MSKRLISLFLLFSPALWASTPFSLGLGVQSFYLDSSARGFVEQDVDAMALTLTGRYDLHEQVSVSASLVVFERAFAAENLAAELVSYHVDAELRTTLGGIRPFVIAGLGYVASEVSGNEVGDWTPRIGFGVEHALGNALSLELSYILTGASDSVGSESATHFGLNYHF